MTTRERLRRIADALEALATIPAFMGGKAPEDAAFVRAFIARWDEEAKDARPLPPPLAVGKGIRGSGVYRACAHDLLTRLDAPTSPPETPKPSNIRDCTFDGKVPTGILVNPEVQRCASWCGDSPECIYPSATAWVVATEETGLHAFCTERCRDLGHPAHPVDKTP